MVRTAELSIKAAETLGVTRLNLHTAELVDGLPARPRMRATGAMWTTALRTLETLGELGAAAGVTFCVENLNTIVDHPGVPLARAKDTLALIEGVGHPNVKMMLDLYHAQIGEGNLIELVRRCGRCHRRDSGRRRPWPVPAGHRRDLLPGDREGPGRHGISPAPSVWRAMPQGTTWLRSNAFRAAFTV